MFNSGMFRVKGGPVPEMRRAWRAWDLAATDGDGNFTVGIKCGFAIETGEFWIIDEVRGQWATAERDSIIRRTAERDGRQTRIFLPQDPGAAGKSQLGYLGKILSGFIVKSERITGEKRTYAEGLASHGGTSGIVLA